MSTNTAEVLRLLKHFTYELFPSKSIKAKNKVISGLPPGSFVSVTCSSASEEPLEATKSLCQHLKDAGHIPVPHFAARLVDGPDGTKQLAEWTKKNEINKVFIIGGDVDKPKYYKCSLSFMKDFIKCNPGVKTIGFAVYPDGHPALTDEKLLEVAIEKQTLLAQHGIQAEATTQMCFDPNKTIVWLKHARLNGFTTPIILGLPGAVDITKLLKIGMTLGVGNSLRFLTKNTSIVANLLGPHAYDPTPLLSAIAPSASKLHITGIHSYTFNATANTATWVDKLLSGAPKR